jgi:cellulose synthase/poly-beta-1,6-N-acetylglucosamine synthase-like glycosyltransferase
VSHPLFWWISGSLLALAWLPRALEALLKAGTITDISTPEWSAGSNLDLPSVTVIVPARNEERAIEDCLRSLACQDLPKLEILAVNDRSIDKTGENMDRLACEYPSRVRVIHIRELPQNWLGKTHAMWLGAREAKAKWLLFTDGDVVFAPDTLSRAVAYAAREAADHVVVYPTLELHSVAERSLIGFFMTVFLAVNRPWKIADPRARESIGVGAFNMIRREAYEEIGTYESLRMNVIDDLSLGRRVKQHGLRQRMVVGPELVRLRWAHSAVGIMLNLEKNFFALMRFRLSLTIIACLLTIIMSVGPFVGLILAPGLARLPFALAVIAIAALYATFSRWIRIAPLYFALHPLAAVVVAATMLNSALHAIINQGIIWRGTKYSLKQLRDFLNQ